MRRVFTLSLLLGGLSWSLPAQSITQPDALVQAKRLERLERTDSTVRHARRAAAVARRQQQWNEYAYALGWLGDHHRRQKQYDSAFFYLSQALVTVTSNTTPDTTNAITYHRLGKYYKDINRPDQAVEVLRQALRIRESRADATALVLTYKDLASVYRYIYYDYITAEQYYRQALRLLESLSKPNERQLFVVLYSLATTNRMKQDYDKALTYGYRAAALARRLDERSQEVCYTMLGNILEDQDDLPSAIRNFKRALSLGITRLGRRHPDLIIRHNNLAAAYIHADSVDQGLRMLRTAEEIYRSNPRTELKDNLADTYEYRGDAYVKQAKLPEAHASYRRSLAINRSFYGPKHPLTAKILSTIADLHRRQYHYDSALYYRQRSLIAAVPNFHQSNSKHNPTVAMMRNDPLNFRLLEQKAQVLLEQPNASLTTLGLALHCFAQADSLIDSCRVLYDREMARLSFLGENQRVYEQAVACAYQLYQITEEEQYLDWAFHFMEKSKAVVLWESLVDSQIKSSVGIPDSLLAREHAVNQELTYVNSQLFAAQASSDTTVAHLRSRQFALARQRETLTRVLQEQHPRYFRIKYGQARYTLTQAQRHTRTTGTSLVEYLWGDQHVYAIGILPERTVLVRTLLNDTLRQTLRTVQRALQHPPRVNQRPEDFRLYTVAAHRLYQQLLAPVLSSSSGRMTEPGLFGSIREAQQQTHAPPLTIVPDGPLSYLPFEALLVDLPEPGPTDYRHLAYMIDDFAISYSPSARVLTQRPSAQSVRQAMRFLAFGYSESRATSSVSEASLPNSALPGTAREIRALNQMAEGTYYLGAEATESHFKAEAKHYDVIHLAVHGQADTLHPNNSRLIFRNEQDSTEDGVLYSFELYDLQLRADLAVLSACESGIGKLLPGEGVYSLARGFAYAGCPTVVMSLWKVDDQQTSELMPTFYRALYDGSTVDQALRTAKVRYREQCHSFFAHPAFWSAFVVDGVTAPVVSYRTTHRAARLILLLSAIYLAVALYRRRKQLRPDRQQA